jgi:hypothetical protein
MRVTEIMREQAMKDFGLSHAQAVEYVMERRNGMNHEDALVACRNSAWVKGDKS